ncbi:amidohydrolase family protein [Shewanella surugensis]|uniref:Amidohydrolase family protein n=1 Tax=Shewanella surugensis TaxID=212020 RepID=A0ABT0LDF6_9GAMM|nr:amidohydrolase family protein [Shewanella surugensis]MCL1125604.1 amidohydrolase family protein [Shewanella surugensis]
MINSLSVPHLFDGESFHQNKTLYIEQGIIVDIKETVSASNLFPQTLLVPGFINLQVNGGGGALFNQSPTLTTLNKISQRHQTFGTTAILPTLITDNIQVMRQATNAIAQAIKLNLPCIIGIHFEGPHLSIEKKGAHKRWRHTSFRAFKCPL